VDNILKIILANFFKYFSKCSPAYTAEIAWSFFCRPRIRKKPLSKNEEKLLSLAKQYFVDSGDYKIAVYEWCNSDYSEHTKTILLTHGWGGHALNFSHVISKLYDEGFNVIAHDSPAHGKSSGKKTNLLHNTTALLNVCDQIPSVTMLIGHSFGAMASAYAFERTKDTAIFSKLNKMVLIAGPNKLTDIFASFTQAMGLPNVVLDIFHQKLEVIANRNIRSMSTTEFLRNYSGEALVVHDHNDRVVPFSEAEAISNEVATASLYSTNGCGHFRILSAKNMISKIVDFINNPYNNS